MKHGITAVIFLVALVGCDESTAPLDRTASVVSSSAKLIRTYDDELQEFNSELPGFAGVFIDESGAFVTVMKSGSDTTNARAKIGKLLERIRPGASQANERARLQSSFRVRFAKYDFRELRGWYDQIAPRILSIPGVDLAPATQAKSLRGTNRPVYGGVQFNALQGDCTVGFNVSHSLSYPNVDQAEYFVTAVHCTPQYGVADSGVIAYQPGAPQAIAKEWIDPAVFGHGADSRCPLTRDCRYSDAALFKYTISDWAHARVAWPTLEGDTMYSTFKG